MKNIALDKIISFLMFLYILSIYIFTFREDLNLISNVLALILIGAIWFNFLLTRRKLVFNTFLFIYLLFIIICFVSVFYAIDQSLALSKIRTLILLFILMLSLLNYIDTFKKLKKLIYYFVISGFIASIYILFNSDLSQITRFGGDLGNVNAVGLILGISSIFCFYFLLSKRSIFLMVVLITNTFVILLTGSRKSFLFIFVTYIVVFLSQNKSGITGKLKTLIIGFIMMIIGLYLIFNIPFLYEIVGFRVESLLDFVTKEGTNDASINIRVNMIELGLEWFKERPITGYGIDNYRVLYGGTYSHNNFIELLVGLGIFGAFVFYLMNALVLKDLFKTTKKGSGELRILCYCIMSIIFMYILLSAGLVYYYSKHISIIIAIGSVVYRLSKSKMNKSVIKKEK